MGSVSRVKTTPELRRDMNKTIDINDRPRIAARFISGFFTGLSTRTSSREGDSTFLSANSAGAVALEITATLWNGDPGGASGVTAPLEFDLLKHTDCKAQVSDLLIDEFISDNLLDECVINATGADNTDNKVTDIVSISVSKERPAGTMRGFAEGTLGAPSAISIASRVLFSWLRRSPVRACLSWRAERLARNLFSGIRMNKAGNPPEGLVEKTPFVVSGLDSCGARIVTRHVTPLKASGHTTAKSAVARPDATDRTLSTIPTKWATVTERFGEQVTTAVIASVSEAISRVAPRRLPRRPAVAELLAMTLSFLGTTTRKFTTRIIAEICQCMSVINHNSGRPWGLHYRPQFL